MKYTIFFIFCFSMFFCGYIQAYDEQIIQEWQEKYSILDIVPEWKTTWEKLHDGTSSSSLDSFREEIEKSKIFSSILQIEESSEEDMKTIWFGLCMKHPTLARNIENIVRPLYGKAIDEKILDSIHNQIIKRSRTKSVWEKIACDCLQQWFNKDIKETNDLENYKRLTLDDGRKLIGNIKNTQDNMINFEILSNTGKTMGSISINKYKIIKEENIQKENPLLVLQKKAYERLLRAIRTKKYTVAYKIYNDLANKCIISKYEQRVMILATVPRLLICTTPSVKSPFESTFSRLPRCRTCRGKITIRCNVCNGKGVQICPVCKGEKFIREETDEVIETKCSQCKGQGEIATGQKRERVLCKDCKGTGRIEKFLQCATCKGEGHVNGISCEKCKGNGGSTSKRKCRKCDKSGKVWVLTSGTKKVCPKCKGKKVFTSSTIGKKKVPCAECNGSGKIGECTRCRETGKLKCSNCKATGMNLKNPLTRLFLEIIR